MPKFKSTFFRKSKDTFKIGGFKIGGNGKKRSPFSLRCLRILLLNLDLQSGIYVLKILTGFLWFIFTSELVKRVLTCSIIVRLQKRLTPFFYGCIWFSFDFIWRIVQDCPWVFLSSSSFFFFGVFYTMFWYFDNLWNYWIILIALNLFVEWIKVMNFSSDDSR